MDMLFMFAVVGTTALFLLRHFTAKIAELKGTQETLLQFFEEFETEQSSLYRKIEEKIKQIHDYEKIQRDLDQLRRDRDLLQEEIEKLRNELNSLAQSIETNNGPEVAQEANSDFLQLRERYQHVWQLYQKGSTIEEIAKETGRGKGEIQLILDLLQRSP
jgi:septation ring formation regulator EzrA